MTEQHSLPPHYEIRIRGRLGASWSTWLDGLTITATDDGSTVISGPIVDQAALHGLLARLRDLGITLESLVQVAPGDPSPEPRVTTDTHPNEPGATTS